MVASTALIRPLRSDMIPFFLVPKRSICNESHLQLVVAINDACIQFYSDNKYVVIVAINTHPFQVPTFSDQRVLQ